MIKVEEVEPSDHLYVWFGFIGTLIEAEIPGHNVKSSTKDTTGANCNVTVKVDSLVQFARLVTTHEYVPASVIEMVLVVTPGTTIPPFFHSNLFAFDVATIVNS
jgi:hypothetical protein